MTALCSCGGERRQAPATGGRGQRHGRTLPPGSKGETERSLADEAAGPLAQLIAVPQDGGAGTGDEDDDEDTDPLALMKADIAKARGKAMLVETTAAGWAEGKGAAPSKDWKAERLGPQPPEALVALSKAAFARMLAACGCSPALFDDSDGTAKREALRQWHLGTVVPLARILEHEISMRLAVPVRLRFDAYPLDLAGRAQAFQKLVAGGVSVNEALVTAGLLAEDAMMRVCPDCDAPREGQGRCACGSYAAPQERRETVPPRFKNGRQLAVGEGGGAPGEE